MRQLWEKLLEVFSSIRFWFIVCGAAIYFLVNGGYITKEIGDALMIILFGAPAVGTIDKLGNNIAKNQ